MNLPLDYSRILLRGQSKTVLTKGSGHGRMHGEGLRTRRIMYSLGDPPKIILPGPDPNARRTGKAEMPEKAKVSEHDQRLARLSQPLFEPKSRDDMKKYIHRLGSDDLFRNVMKKTHELQQDSPGKDIYNWTIGKHLGHGPSLDTTGGYDTLDWSGARRAIHHNAIMNVSEQMARVIRGDDKNFVLLIGSPGSGKSTYGTHYTKHHIVRYLTEINPDLIREFYPEYEGHNEAATHRESQLLTTGPMLKHAYDNNHHILLNVPGSDPEQMEHHLRIAREKGYKTHMVYVSRDPYKSINGTWERFRTNAYGANHPDKPPSRFVLPTYTMSIAEKPIQTFERLRNGGLLDSWVSIEPPEKYNKHGEGYIIKETDHVRRRI